MARLTKTQSEKKKADIAALLTKNVLMADIAAQLHCSLRMVTGVKRGGNGNVNGNASRSSKGSQDPGLQAEVAELKGKLADREQKIKFLGSFFKDNFETLDARPKAHAFMMAHEEFDEVEKICQA